MARGLVRNQNGLSKFHFIAIAAMAGVFEDGNQSLCASLDQNGGRE